MSSSQQFASMPAKVAVPSLGPPKKQRRRRSAASGAADDCHACRARNVKCDRQRPYCQQCLDMGKDCSGYKQALTWNQGIASRGHLRGLSSPAAQRPASKTEDRRTRPRSQLSSSPRLSSTSSSPLQKATQSETKRRPVSLGLDQKTKESSSPSMISPSCIMPMHTPDWQLPSPSFSDNFSHVQKLGQSFEINEPFLYIQNPMQGLQVPQHPRLSSIGEYSGSLSSASGIGEMDWPSPSEYPQTPDPAPRPVPTFSPNYTSMGNCSSSRNSYLEAAPTSCPDVFSSSTLDGFFTGDQSTAFQTSSGMDDLGLCGLSGIMFDSEPRDGTLNLDNFDMGYSNFDYSMMPQQPSSPFIYEC